MSSYPDKIKGFYLSHGGGPMPLMGDPAHEEMVEHLKAIGQQVHQPSTIIMISAHWETDIISITSGESPEMIYDYYGFPEETYQYDYPAPGNPELARNMSNTLTDGGIENMLDPQRGFDHGMFVPLMLMFPEARIPCVQISLSQSLDPKLHMQVGTAIGSAMSDDCLIIGSGFSFHNMRAFREPSTPETQGKNKAFEAWLIDTCTNPNISEIKRKDLLANWENAPNARYCQPREEHLLPLHVCYGAFEHPAIHHIELSVMDKKSSMYMW